MLYVCVEQVKNVIVPFKSYLLYSVCVFYQDLVGKYSQQMVKGMLQLLSNCPSETAHLRKELLIAAKHILTTDLRSRMYTHTHTRTGVEQENAEWF